MVTDFSSGLVLTASVAWRQIIHLGPYVLGGVFLAALLNQTHLLRRWCLHLDCHGPLSFLGATCLGVLSPVSAYSTVPILHEMLRAGTSPGPVLSFLAASSMLNPQLFLITLGGLGSEMAVMQVTGVVGMSLIIGLVANGLGPNRLIRRSSSPASISTSPKPSWSGFLKDILRLVEWVGFTFLVGVILSALIQVFIPTRWILPLTEGNRWGVTLFSGLLGIPLYTCGGAAVPVLAQLMQSGMRRGAVLAFLMTGAATRITTLSAVGSILNKRAFFLYVIVIVTGSVIFGVLL